MLTIHATEVAEAAKNTYRSDWVDGAANLVLENKVQYDRSIGGKIEPFICRDNILSDIDVTEVINGLLDGAECCACREKLNELIYSEACEQLKQMADDFDIGVK